MSPRNHTFRRLAGRRSQRRIAIGTFASLLSVIVVIGLSSGAEAATRPTAKSGAKWATTRATVHSASMFAGSLARIEKFHHKFPQPTAPVTVTPPVTVPVVPTPTPTPIPTDPAPTSPTPSPTDPAPTSPTPTPTPSDPNGTLLWSDEFNGPAGSAPDRSKWDNVTGGNGFGNNELECYTDNRANSALDGNGDLVITARYQPGYQCPGGTTNDYTSAKLVTYGLATMKYGKLRVRADLPTASGLWPAIWALGDDNYSAGWPKSGEIDVAEVIGSAPNTVYGTIHGPMANGNAYGIGGQQTLPSNLNSGFHTYGVDWSPDSVTFSLDDTYYKTISRSQVIAQGAWVFDHPYFMLLNVAVGGNWPGSPSNNAVFPQTMTVDYVRIYK